jgi:hypothetical protein
MAPQKIMNKTDASSEGANPNADVLSYTTPRAIDTVKYWTHVFEILEHEVINCPEDFGDEVDDSHGVKIIIISHSKLHKISTRPRIMSYNDMIGWALENVDIQTRSVFNSQKVVVGSFQLEHIHVMYKLSLDFKYNHNAKFMLKFEQ